MARGRQCIAGHGKQKGLTRSRTLLRESSSAARVLLAAVVQFGFSSSSGPFLSEHSAVVIHCPVGPDPRSTVVIVRATGPRMRPDAPNESDRRPRKTRGSCEASVGSPPGRSSCRFHRRRPLPHGENRFPQLPSTLEAAGIQTMKAPNTGTTASKAITTPQTTAPAGPATKHQSAQGPCTEETASVP